MRLDKFLKVSRLIKRRTVAKDVSEQGRVLVTDVKRSQAPLSKSAMSLRFSSVKSWSP